MCPQTVGLIAAAIESAGIPTVCAQPVRHIAEKVRPPRSLLFPFKQGFPLGRPNDPELQHRVLDQMLAMLEDPQRGTPALSEFAR